MSTPLGPGYAKATITEWNLGASNASGSPVSDGVSLTVDFDPASLQLRYAVTAPNAGQQTQSSGVQRNKAPAQRTTATTTLSMTLVFDSTANGTSVQLKTDELVKLTNTAPATSTSKPPAARVMQFAWGSFAFYGSVTSMSQTLEYFSAQGTPLRATVELSLQQVDRPPATPAASSGSAPPTGYGSGVGTAGSAGTSASASAPTGISASTGTTPLTLSAAGDTVQGIAAQAGTSVSWKVVAAANNIDNPRILAPGTVLDLSAGASASLVAGASAGASPSIQVQTS
jgi:LysM repeat protein